VMGTEVRQRACFRPGLAAKRPPNTGRSPKNPKKRARPHGAFFLNLHIRPPPHANRLSRPCPLFGFRVFFCEEYREFSSISELQVARPTRGPKKGHQAQCLTSQFPYGQSEKTGNFFLRPLQGNQNRADQGNFSPSSGNPAFSSALFFGHFAFAGQMRFVPTEPRSFCREGGRGGGPPRLPRKAARRPILRARRPVFCSIVEGRAQAFPGKLGRQVSVRRETKNGVFRASRMAGPFGSCPRAAQDAPAPPKAAGTEVEGGGT